MGCKEECVFFFFLGRHSQEGEIRLYAAWGKDNDTTKRTCMLRGYFDRLYWLGDIQLVNSSINVFSGRSYQVQHSLKILGHST